MKKVLGIFAMGMMAFGSTEGMNFKDKIKLYNNRNKEEPKALFKKDEIKIDDEKIKRLGEDVLRQNKFEINHNEVGKLGEDQFKAYKGKAKEETIIKGPKKVSERTVPSPQINNNGADKDEVNENDNYKESNYAGSQVNNEESNLEEEESQQDDVKDSDTMVISEKERAFIRAATLRDKMNKLEQELDRQNMVMWALEGLKECLDNLAMPQKKRVGNKTNKQLKSEISLTKETYKNVIDLSQYENDRKKLEKATRGARKQFDEIANDIKKKQEELAVITEKYGDGWKQLLNDSEDYDK